MVEWFERLAGLLFIGLMVGIVLYLTYLPIPQQNEQSILIIIGVLSATATLAGSKVFSQEDKEKTELAQRVEALEKVISQRDSEIEAQRREIGTLTLHINQVTRMLVDRHVVRGEGIVMAEERE